MRRTAWIRMALAFSIVLLIGGMGLVLAAPPNPKYPPYRSELLGQTVVLHNSSVHYTLRVLFTNGAVLDFPPTTGAGFAAARGAMAFTGDYTAPPTGSKDRITGSFFSPAWLLKVSSSLVITLK